LCGVTVAETILVYAVVPLVIVAVMAALTLRPDPKARRRRYRAGQPWEHEPVWYTPHAPAAAHGSAVDTAAQPHGRTQALGSSVYGEVGAGDSHGAARPTQGALAAGAPAAGRGGPLGGARGTW
jgi:hypothetical protein